MPDRDLRDAHKAAAGWVVRMASDQRTRSDEEAFEAWLASDPANAAAYADHELLWRGVGDLTDNDEARQILGLSRPEPEISTVGVSRRWMLGAGGGAAALAASAAFVTLWPRGVTTYETVPGEQRTITLADGSSVTLNTATRLEVDFRDEERRLSLVAGQAYFKVAKDPERPFRVFVGNDEVRAIGTAFDIRRDGNRALVTLEEGVVALYRGTAKRSAVPISIAKSSVAGRRDDRPIAILEPGERAAIQPAIEVKVASVDVKREQAWRLGRIILDETPLGEAVADLNRYGGRRIVLDDPALANLKVSGVFHTSRPEAFVAGVTAALPVRLKNDTATSLVLDAR